MQRFRASLIALQMPARTLATLKYLVAPMFYPRMGMVPGF